ncbi:MAG TPA: hypothetical protein DG757_23410 [Bacillus sp. (in: Bacteria)]|nr:hypothetical protein [Bacillus sp. (in: firmicutes)]
MRYIKFGIYTIIVMMAELGLSYLLAEKFNYYLLDMMFYVGLFSSVFFIFFSSTGGLPTNYSEIRIALSYTGIKNNYKFKRTFGSLSVNCFVLGSVLFFLVGFMVAFSI